MTDAELRRHLGEWVEVTTRVGTLTGQLVTPGLRSRYAVRKPLYGANEGDSINDLPPPSDILGVRPLADDKKRSFLEIDEAHREREAGSA